MDTIQEDSRSIPVSAGTDVVVCGAGPAGVAAAVASARSGAKTTLIETQGCLGGTWTSGCMSWIIDHQNKTGLMKEIMDRLENADGRAVADGTPTNAFDVEKMKLVLDTLCLENGVDVLLHTWLAGAVRSGTALTHVLTESKSGRQALAGKVFIDCTGDGDLGAHAGCGFDLGHPETGKTQPMSLLALVAGIDPGQVRPYYRNADEVPWTEPKDRLREQMEQGGHSPSYGKPTLFWIRDDLFMLMANHEYGCFGTDAGNVSRATLRARKELHDLIDGLRGLGGIWGGLRIVATPNQIGVREGRRIHGRYTVTADDMVAGKRHEDAVCTVTFGVDVHSTDNAKTKGIEPSKIRTQPYDIPLRALIAGDVDRLMMAGRCISGDFLSHSSYRVTGNAVAMGEAAGRVAAAAALSDRLPHEVSLEETGKTGKGENNIIH